GNGDVRRPVLLLKLAFEFDFRWCRFPFGCGMGHGRKMPAHDEAGKRELATENGLSCLELSRALRHPGVAGAAISAAQTPAPRRWSLRSGSSIPATARASGLPRHWFC